MESPATETHLEKLVEERQFAGILQSQSEIFFRLSNALLGSRKKAWNKRHFFQLVNETEALESILDDYGARYNRTYAFLTELVASLRGFAMAGTSVTHLLGRLGSYGELGLEGSTRSELQAAVERAGAFIRSTVVVILDEAHAEAHRLGVEVTPEAFAEDALAPSVARRRLPRNVGQADLVDEKQKIAEVATKFLQACEAIGGANIRPIDDAEERRRFLAEACTEERARVYEATVHNLQSTYDTHVQNTVLEANDDRLQRLRGNASVALHLLEAVTHLTHFIERHEDEIRSEEVKRRISELVSRTEVQDVTLNALFVWADRVLQGGRAVAEDLLPEYTNVQEIELSIPEGTRMHARPASLIVAIVQRHGTPVEAEMDGKRCNAGSILELLVMVGSRPRVDRIRFRGDERPLRDIERLFAHGLGEGGLDELPRELAYLRE